MPLSPESPTWARHSTLQDNQDSLSYFSTLPSKYQAVGWVEYTIAKEAPRPTSTCLLGNPWILLPCYFMLSLPAREDRKCSLYWGQSCVGYQLELILWKKKRGVGTERGISKLCQWQAPREMGHPLEQYAVTGVMDTQWTMKVTSLKQAHTNLLPSLYSELLWLLSW
jgi:hypothetical protein